MALGQKGGNFYCLFVDFSKAFYRIYKYLLMAFMENVKRVDNCRVI